MNERNNYTNIIGTSDKSPSIGLKKLGVRRNHLQNPTYSNSFNGGNN